MTNGFYVYNWSGTSTNTSRSYSSTGSLVSTNTSQAHFNETGVVKSLLNADFGLRFFFDTKKSSQKKKDCDNSYF